MPSFASPHPRYQRSFLNECGIESLNECGIESGWRSADAGPTALGCHALRQWRGPRRMPGARRRLSRQGVHGLPGRLGEHDTHEDDQ